MNYKNIPPFYLVYHIISARALQAFLAFLYQLMYNKVGLTHDNEIADDVGN
jgi:hypothetical protein